MPFIAQLGQQAASAALQAGMGLVFGGLQGNQQYNQSRRLQKLQIQGAKEMADYNQMKAMEYWNSTSYPAQVAKMKEAGLNIGLMSGGSGPGGSSLPGAGGGMPSAVATPNMGMGIQAGIAASQMRLMEAQAKNLDADTKGKMGETEPAKGQLALLAAQTTNEKLKSELIKTDGLIKKFEAEIKEKGIDWAIRSIEAEAKLSEERLQALQRENHINEQTKEDAVKKIRAEAIGAILRNSLTEAQTDVERKKLELTDAQIENMVQEIMVANRNADINQQKANTEEMRAKYEISQRTWDRIMSIVKFWK